MSARVITGEAAIIREYFAPLAAGYPGAFGLTDDCAAITPPPGFDLVVKTDPIRAGVHFFADDPPRTIGWKALAVNVSDLAAKGAQPHAYTMALAFPEAPTDDWLRAFADGLADAQAAYGCHLIGGDTDKATGPLSIAITAFGLVPTGKMVRRGTARAGDIVYVSGTLGDAALGLRLRRNDTEAAAWPLDATLRDHLAERYLRPQARVPLSSALLAYATAAMDLSDGLVKDLGRMVAASGVGASVDILKLPLSSAARAVVAHDDHARALIWGGGDDYEILCAVPRATALEFNVAATRAGVPVTLVGEITANRKLAFPSFEDAVAKTTGGWDHF